MISNKKGKILSSIGILTGCLLFVITMYVAAQSFGRTILWWLFVAALIITLPSYIAYQYYRAQVDRTGDLSEREKAKLIIKASLEEETYDQAKEQK